MEDRTENSGKRKAGGKWAHFLTSKAKLKVTLSNRIGVKIHTVPARDLLSNEKIQVSITGI